MSIEGGGSILHRVMFSIPSDGGTYHTLCLHTASGLLLQLVAVLREVKYLEIRGSEEIPRSAAEMYSKNQTFRQYVANLDLTVQWYNKVIF